MRKFILTTAAAALGCVSPLPAEPAAPEAKQAEEAKPADVPSIDIPVAEGEDVFGIRIPHYDEAGVLIFQLSAERARKTGKEDVEMEVVDMEFYDEDGERFEVKIPKSVFHLAEKTLSGKDGAIISRKDFKIEGRTILFDMQAQAGSLGGPVTMTLFNTDSTEP